MRRHLLVVALVLIAAACSSSEPMAVEFVHAADHGTLSYTASGVAVDEGVIHTAGTKEMVRLENMDGEVITDEDWETIFDAALEEGSVAEMMIYEEWNAADDSGSFTLEFHNLFDLAVFQFQGRQDVGTWEVTGGTGDYANLTGSGSVTMDFDAGIATYEGTVEG